MKRSPSLEGVKAIFRQPSFGFAEMSWRWSIGSAAILLFTLTFYEYLNTLPVSAQDILLLKTGQLAFMGRALQHIFRGSAPRVLLVGLLLVVAYAISWVVAGSLGRAATLKAVLKYFEDRAGLAHVEKSWRLRSLFGLNALRVIGTLAAGLGCIGAVFLGSAVSTEKHPSPGTAMLIFSLVVMLALLAWSVVNWFLSLASVFVITQGENTFGAIAAAAELFRQRTGAVFAVGCWYGFAHVVAWFVANSAIAFPMAFLTVLPGGVVFGGMLLVLLLYFAVVDFLYVGRLAAYVVIAESGNFPRAPEFVPPILPEPPSTRMDPSERILSDVPLFT